MKKKVVTKEFSEIETQDKEVSISENEMLIKILGKAYRSHMNYYIHNSTLSFDEMHGKMIMPPTKDSLDRIKETPYEELSWHHLHMVMEQSPAEFITLWEEIKSSARGQMETGAIAAQVVRRKTPFDEALFLERRKSFQEVWQPRGGIENALIDIIAQADTAFQHWLKVIFILTDFENYMVDEKVERSGSWHPPLQSFAETLNQAMQMADRFNRLYLRTLRQMRDLRRYSQPIIVQSAEQINIASDGGQQVNVTRSKNRKPKAKTLSKGRRNKD